MNLKSNNLEEEFMKQAFKDDSTYKRYMYAKKLMNTAVISHFGKIPNWDELKISEKTYHGWMKPYMIATEAICTGRWMYWLDIRASGVVENKPIPQINFYSSTSKEYKFVADMIKKCLNHNHYYVSGYKMFELFIDWLLYAWGSSSVQSLPKEIDDELNLFWYKNFKGYYLTMFPADYFVSVASEIYSNSTFNSNSFYSTPDSVVKMMVDMTFGGVPSEEQKYMKMYEPCVGSGIMLLYSSNYTLRMYAQDIDLLMTKLATLNGFFYIPWLVDSNSEIEKILDSAHEKTTKQIA